VSPRKVAEAHEEFVDDLPAGKSEGLAEEPRPILDRAWVVPIEPMGKRSVRLAQLLDALCIFDRGHNLEPVAYDPGIGQQAVDIGRAEGRNAIDLEIGERGAKGGAFV